MNRHLVFAGTLTALLLASQSAMAQVTIDVIPSIGPNGNGSPNIYNYGNAAMYSLTGGAVGTPAAPNTPGFYAPTSGTIPPSNVIATSTPSWLGNPNPTGAYANEVGNNLFFGMKVTSATPFLLSQASYNLSNSTPANTGLSNLGQLQGAFGSNFSPFLVGYNKNTGQYYTNPSQDADPITSLFYVGPGTAFNGGSNPTATLAALQAEFPNGILFSGGTVTIGGNTYNVTPASGPLIATPEPASMGILAVGVVGLFGYATYRRRRLVAASSVC